jgi:tetratricopeptide (TPR) repeat protein
MAKLARLQTFTEATVEEPLQRRARRPRTRYFAFLSYSHQDKELAEWLHHELERFRVPRSLVGRLTENGVVPRRLTPIFRDQHDLAAADNLTVEITGALAVSQFLVVLCSPTAAKSRWTNLEIEWFKRTRPDGSVFAAIAAGEPFGSDMPGRAAEECFPPALRYKYDRRGHQTQKRAEALAADFREGAGGRRLAFLKLVSGMLGVGLDELVQRETTRRQRRLAILAAASLAGMGVTSTLAIAAIEARDAARDQRREAEGLIGFMLGDLKDKLEPIGRLDALDGVGSRVLAYYQKEGTSDLPDAALMQRSRALALMGEVANLRGNMESSMRFYREARAGTAEAIRRDPSDPQRVYDHAQNVFWVGDLYRQRGDLATAEKGMREYKQLAAQMIALDPNNMKWRMEEQDADANLGIVLYERRRFPESATQLQQAVQMTRALATADPRNEEYQKNLAEILAWLADAKMSAGDLATATRIREQHVALLNRFAAQPGSDVEYRQKLIPAEQALGWLHAYQGQTEAALRHFRTSVATADQLIPVEPANTLWLDFAMVARLALADTLLKGGQAEEAATQTEAACATARSLLARDPSRPYWRGGARTCWTMRAKLASSGGRMEESLHAAERAIAIGATVKSSDPADDQYGLASAYLALGDAERTLANEAAATNAWQKALATLPAGVAERPSEMDQHATILQRLGRAAEARRIVSRLNAIGYRRNA